jgi:outer membrane lipase/esterase
MFGNVLRRCIAVVMLVVPTCGYPATFGKLYVVGDSLSDQGNLFAATAPLVGPLNALPASDHYFAGRFSNGPVYTDFISQSLGLPLTPSLLGGNNFAFGGARTTYNTVEQVVGGPFPNGLFPWSLNAEVAAFKSRGIHDTTGLYIVFSGSNDIADILARAMNPAVVIPTTVGGVLNAVQAFKDAGAQTIVVPNVPDLGRTPAFRVSAAASAAATAFSVQYNAALHAALATVTDVDLIEFDTFGVVNDIINNPAAFGFTNVTTPCYTGFVERNPTATECANADQAFFWDLVHPTTRVHGILANEILASLPVPSTLPLLLLGFGALAALCAGPRFSRA